MIQQEYRQLIALTQLYLLRNFKLKDAFCASLADFEAFEPLMQKFPEKKVSPPPPLTPPPPKKILPKKTPPPPPKKALAKKIEKPPITLSTPDASSSLSFKEIREEIKACSPSLKLHDTPPCDKIAQEKSQLWKEQHQAYDVMIFSPTDHPPHHAFLIKVATALQNHKKRVWVGDPSNPEAYTQFPSPRLVIVSRSHAAQYSSIDRACGEESKKIILNSIADYLNDPVKKRELWNQLKKALDL